MKCHHAPQRQILKLLLCSFSEKPFKLRWYCPNRQLHVQVNNKNTSTRSENFVNFEHISHLVSIVNFEQVNANCVWLVQIYQSNCSPTNSSGWFWERHTVRENKNHWYNERFKYKNRSFVNLHNLLIQLHPIWKFDCEGMKVGKIKVDRFRDVTETPHKYLH